MRERIVWTWRRIGDLQTVEWLWAGIAWLLGWQTGAIALVVSGLLATSGVVQKLPLPVVVLIFLAAFLITLVIINELSVFRVRRRLARPPTRGPFVARGMAQQVRDMQREQERENAAFGLVQRDGGTKPYKRPDLGALSQKQRENLFEFDPQFEEWWHGKPLEDGAWTAA